MDTRVIPQKYYYDMADFYNFALNGYCSFDHNNVPKINYDHVFKLYKLLSGHNFGMQYNITAVCQFGLGALSLYNDTANADYKDIFLQQCRWLRDNLKIIDEKYGYWHYNFYFPSYDLKPPFISGMAQGQGLSVLLRAYQITEDKSFLHAAHLVFNTFGVDTESGGCTVYDAEGNIWFEEYPSSPPSYVLNGYVFALFGIYDYLMATNSKVAFSLWEKGITSLKNTLHLYDTHYWSKYDRYPGRVAAVNYHKVHINQMQILYVLTKEDIFNIYATKWSQNLNKRICIIRAKITRLNLLRKLTSVSGIIRERTKKATRLT